MIDPILAAGVRPADLGIDTPLQAATGQQQYTNLRNVGQLQQQQIQQQDVALKTHAALNQAIAANTKQGADGKYTTDDNGVIQSLAQSGMGSVAQQYRLSQANLQRQLEQLDDEKLKHISTLQDMTDGKLGTLLSIKAPAKRQAAWEQETKWATDNQLAKPGDFPQQAPADDELQSMLMRSASGRQAIEIEIKRRQQQSLEQYQQSEGEWRKAEARRYGAQEDLYNAQAQNYLRKANQATFTRQFDKDNHPIMEGADGKLFVDQSITGAPYVETGGSGSGRGSTLTPNAYAAEQARIQRDYEANAKAEIGYRQERDSLASALNAGNLYLPEGKAQPVPFSKKTNSQGAPLSAEEINALKDEMQKRLDAANAGVEESVSNKNNAMDRMAELTGNQNARPKVSTADAINAYRGAKAPGGGQQKTARLADVKKYAAKKGVSLDQAMREFKQANYRIQ